MRFISPLSWIGGKGKYIKKVLKYFPNNIDIYVEPFFGGGSIGLTLLYEKRIKYSAVFSDINPNLMNFWKGVKNNLVCDKYPKIIGNVDDAKEAFNKMKVKQIKKPFEFLYINRLSFSGIEDAGFSKTRYQLKYYNCLDRVKVCELLLNNNKVKLLNLDYKEIIKIYDSSKTLFYLDPPYYNVSKKLYKYEYFNFNELKEVLTKIKGNFILSLNSDPYILDLFKDFNIYNEHWKWQMKNGANSIGKKADELIITNFKIWGV